MNGVTGIHRNWRQSTIINYQSSIQKAAKARDRLAAKYHGPYAHLNFPPEEEAEGRRTWSETVVDPNSPGRVIQARL